MHAFILVRVANGLGIKHASREGSVHALFEKSFAWEASRSVAKGDPWQRPREGEGLHVSHDGSRGTGRHAAKAELLVDCVAGRDPILHPRFGIAESKRVVEHISVVRTTLATSYHTVGRGDEVAQAHGARQAACLTIIDRAVRGSAW